MLYIFHEQNKLIKKLEKSKNERVVYPIIF